MLANVGEEIAPGSEATALDLLEYNLGRYPENEQTYLTMAQIHMATADTASAIRALERGLEQDPENAFFRRAIRQLGGQ